MMNPIEEVLSKTKFSARNMLASPQNNENFVNVIKQSIETVTAQDCNNWSLPPAAYKSSLV